MKEKIEQAIKECLEEEGYFVRSVEIGGNVDLKDLDRDFIGHFVGVIGIRASK